MKDYSRLRPLKGSHVHRKCGVKEMVQDRRVSYGLSICAISNDFGWPWRSFACCRTYQVQLSEHLCDISHGFNWHGASRGPSAIAALLVFVRQLNAQNRARTNVSEQHARLRHASGVRHALGPRGRYLTTNECFDAQTDMVFTLCSLLYNRLHNRLYYRLGELCKWAQPSGAWAVQPGRMTSLGWRTAKRQKVNRWRMVVSGTWKYDEPEVENVTISMSHERLCVSYVLSYGQLQESWIISGLQ